MAVDLEVLAAATRTESTPDGTVRSLERSEGVIERGHQRRRARQLTPIAVAFQAAEVSVIGIMLTPRRDPD